MFSRISGIPAHPLIIHVAVVFIPLLIIAAIVYAAVPSLRRRIDWATAALAVLGPLAALAAKLSGQDLKDQLIAKKLTSPQLLAQIAVHNSYGNHTFWWTLALGIATLVIFGYHVSRGRRPVAADGEGAVAVDRSDTLVRVVSTIVVVIIGVFVGYYVFRTGDTGAHMVWQGF